jgi:2-dehydropantoate 2-reductase
VAAGGTPATLALFDENASIAAAAGFPIGKEAVVRAHTLLTTPGSSLSASMFRDLERGLRLESDHIIGDLLRRAPQPERCPMLNVVAAHLAVYESRRSAAK